MSSTLTITQPSLPIERRELLITPIGDRVESVQTLYHLVEKTLDGVCYSFAEYEVALREMEAEGYQITQRQATPVVRGYDSWDVLIAGQKYALDEQGGEFDFETT